jgi:hypothetical protein
MSIADQKRAVLKYAAEHGYEIVAWFIDDGISGDETDKRREFLRMHHEATTKADFPKIVLCWSQDRFGRFTPQEASYWTFPLAKAGVRLVTVTEGPVDWDDFVEWLSYSVKQHGKHQFLVDLSANVLRRQIQLATDGFLCGQAAPYGFDRMILNEQGEHAQRVRNGDKFVKPRSWHVTLVLSDDGVKLKWARWIFVTYANKSIGLRGLADELNRRGIPGPRGGTWHIGTIREILKNEAYVGTLVWGKRGEGRHHRVLAKSGDIKTAKVNGKKVTYNPRESWIIVEGAWERLVDPKVFKRAQAKLEDRRSKQGQPSSTTTNPENYVLSGVLKCGHCGAKMYGQPRRRRKKDKAYLSRRYVCSTYHTQGKHVCGYHSVDQDVILKAIIRKIKEAVFADGNFEKLKDRIRTRLEARQSADPAEIEALRAKVAELDQELEHGAKRLLRAPDEIADLLGAELAGMRRERDRLSGELGEIERSEAIDVEVEVEDRAKRVWSLGAEIARAKPAGIREVIGRMVSRIDLFFGTVEKRTRTEHPFERGVIELRPDAALCLFNSVSRGDWTSIELFHQSAAAIEPPIRGLVIAFVQGSPSRC